MLTSSRSRRRAALFESLEGRVLLSNYFVSTAGVDGAAGSNGSPWRTLQYAADRVVAGDTVVVTPGNYTGFMLFTSGTASQRIVFSAQDGVTITAPGRFGDGVNLEGASYATIEGFTVIGMTRAGIRSVTNTGAIIRNNHCDQNGVWGVFTGFSENILIENNEASRSVKEHGIYFSNSADNPIIRGNQVWGNNGAGIHMNGDINMGGDGMISGALVENNVIHDNGLAGGSGINCDGVRYSRFQNNLLYNNHASGISLYDGDAAGPSISNVVVNNTIVMASDGRWALNVQNGSTGNVAFNNILYNYHSFRGSIDISADSLGGFVSDYNVVMSRFLDDGGVVKSLSQWRTETGQDPHSIVATPTQLFVNVAGNDYHLSATSAALQAGVAALAGQAAPVTDFEATPRPLGSGYDIGADERDTVAPTLLSAASRKVHGSAGTFDLPLSLTTTTVEPRLNGPSQLVFNFSEPIQASDGLLDASEFGLSPNASYASASLSGSSLTLNLSNLPEGQTVSVQLQGLVDAASNALTGDSDLSVGALLGDVNGNATVNINDVNLVKSKSGAVVDSTTFRYDVNANGSININDVNLVKSRSGRGLSTTAALTTSLSASALLNPQLNWASRANGRGPAVQWPEPLRSRPWLGEWDGSGDLLDLQLLKANLLNGLA